jgi:hypothetical protein
LLSIHYFNTGEGVDDTSGAEICVARTPREHTAAIHSVAAGQIMLPPHQATDVNATCTPKYSDGDIHIIQSRPHMHQRGIGFTSLVQRANGSTETMLDVPFDYNNQIAYHTDMVLSAGDKLLTTCKFQNDTDRTIVLGSTTDDEMCLNDITAWPAGSLYNGTAPDGGEGCYK